MKLNSMIIVKKFKESISLKVNIIIIASIVIVMSIIGFVSLLYLNNKLYDEVIEASTQIANRLKHNLIQPVWEYNYNQINLVISLEMEFPHILAIIYKNLDNEIEVGKIKDKYGKISDFNHSIINDDLKKSFRIIDIPIENNGLVMGAATIFISDRLLKKKLLKLIINTIIQIIILSITISFIILFTLNKLLLKNILKLHEAVKQFSLKDFNVRTSIITGDEIGRLASSFNNMADTIMNYSQSIEDKINERTLQLVELNKQKTSFFINLAHETKTPLTLINNYLEKDINKRGISYELGIVKHNIDKLMRDMINFLDMEKLERGQIFYNHNQILNISDMTGMKADIFIDIANKKNIKISKDIEKDIYIKIDPYAMDRILNNLIDNAIKYNKSEGEVHVGLRKSLEKNKVELEVKDTGIGIDREHMKHIFESYHQVSHEKRNIQGIGMGLNIVKKIVDSIGCRIEVESELLNGAVFKIEFDEYIIKDTDNVKRDICLSKPIDRRMEVKLENVNYSEDKYNLLVIEDNAELISCLQESIKELYNFFYAFNGREALNILEYIPKPHIIISDIMMDVMDGYEFYEVISRNDRYNDIPFIFLTAKTSDEEKLKGLEKGAIDYIYKPFLIEELVAKVNSILKHVNIQKDAVRNQLLKRISDVIRSEFEEDGNYFYFEKVFKKYGISEKEKKVVKLLLDGKEYKEISLKLESPTNTIRKRVHNIYKKFGVHNKIELINILKS